MKRIHGFRSRGSSRRGTAVPLVALSVTMLVGFVALAVDVGYMYVTAAETQRTADASALGGASALQEHKNEVPIENRAIKSATVIMDRNPIARELVSEHAVIEVGHWNGLTRTFSTSVLDRTVTANAVRVVAPRNDLDLYFATIMGFDKTDVSREAIAAASSGKCVGIWGIEGVWARGEIITDSYISTDGEYGSGNIYANGDLCSCQNVEVDGGIVVNGDAMYGRGYAFIPEGTSYRVWGTVSDIPCGVVTMEADFESAYLNNDNDTIGLTERGLDPFGGKEGYHLGLSSWDSLTLSGGTYYFDSVYIDAQAILYVTGPTTIYVAGDAVFTGGGVVNVTKDPADLLIYSNGTNMKLDGSSGFYGVVYAPDTYVTLTGGSTIYGAIVASFVELAGNAWIHVDESVVRDLFDVDPVAPVLVK